MNIEGKRRANILKLEEYFGKRVFVLIYNPLNEKGIDINDETYIEWFLERVIKPEKIRDCVIILNGFGGDFKTAILSSSLLRENLNYYSCLVPSVIGSSLCYFVLQSNKLLVGEKSILTQIDPLFEHNGELLRAIKNLSSIDGEIRKKAHKVFDYNIEMLKNILKKGGLLSKECFSKNNEIHFGELGKIIDLFMGKIFHESGININELKKLKIRLKIENEEIINLANEIIGDCRNELFEEEDYNRFIIHSREGGYFFQ
ncbi:MAG: hypothetical protein PHW73_09815 [Atribacterota bacterium]|nr:hypothetical protein [Atribacterota bacterium]